MKIHSMEIMNLRSIRSLKWKPVVPQLAGWHVVLGDNGSGKSSFLRAMALAFVGPKEAIAARQEWSQWMGLEPTSPARVMVELNRDIHYDSISGQGPIGQSTVFYAGVGVRKNASGVEFRRITWSPKPISAERHVWGSGHGWFSAAYGPFRRFSGGDKDAERIFLSNPKLGAHISVFGESVALTESLLWLRELHYRKLERHPEGALLARLKEFINQPDFLPHGVLFRDVNSNGVEFEGENGNIMAIEDLSDGYRSILSMTFELIRQLCRVFPANKVFSVDNHTIEVPGVVLIDEIDAHLHPTWQKRVGSWFIKHFPKVQFVVTTHSPLICQAAAFGSIFKLASPGTDEKSRMLQGKEFDRLVYGNILDAYSTQAFGISETRSAASAIMQERLATLNNKEMFGQLSQSEVSEQQALRQVFATGMHAEIPQELLA